MDKKDKENAVNEVRLLASINIANVIKFKDTFVDDMKGILYLVMEFADGGDLAVINKLFRVKYQVIRKKDHTLQKMLYGR
jgi:serine/threonine protein kinase